MTPYEIHVLVGAVVIITMALILYTVGVWSERLQKGLLGWHVVFFLAGLCADFVGTSLMAELVRLTGKDDRLHEVTGIIAVALMFIHVMWALWTFRRGSAKAKRNFNKFSIVVWFIWLIPYGIGVYLGMTSHT